MSIKKILSKPFAKIIVKGIKKWSNNPERTQEIVFQKLIKGLRQTKFGRDHNADNINTYEDFKKAIPIRDYESLKPWIDEVVAGKPDILWKGKPIYFAKTSGTTSGAKYIPITKDSISNHIDSARNAILSYIARTGNTGFVDGKMIFLQGSPVLTQKSGINTGRLSGIVAHHVPNYLLKNRMPSWDVNCIEDWEEKVTQIAHETIKERMTLISGIPPWVQMYFEKLIEISGKNNIKEIFPDFNLFIYGGVNYEPYRTKIENSIGKKVDSIETYPASEGFIAYQDGAPGEGLLMVLNHGIFYEFIPTENYFDENPPRLSINEVELNKNYALIINSNAGLWGYSIGDTVKFVSKYPHRIVVTGRIKHFISAFGEHVIGEEVEAALKNAIEEYPCRISEFTVAPQVNPVSGLPYHEWFIEFEQEPDNLENFAQSIDRHLQQKNVYYKDLLEGNILRTLQIRSMQPNAFVQYMKQEGKLGGQNKLPRLSNDRKIADKLEDLVKK
ncbi:MAG: GH3 auxin-responsive promoter family protein [Bacteroidetes bacterium]|nr:GH3 auxin-responsive promoter family protein [Bacteroidota bacterium]